MQKINSLAKHFIEKNDYDNVAAREEMIEFVINDPEYLEYYTKPLVAAAIKKAIQSVSASIRYRIVKGIYHNPDSEEEVPSKPEPKPSKSSPPSVPTMPKGFSGENAKKGNTNVAVSTIIHTALKFRLNNAKVLLKDATHNDLAKEINVYANHSKWNEYKRIWLTKIYESLEEGKKVSEIYSGPEIESLYEEAEKEVDKSWEEKYKRVVEEKACVN